MFRRCISAFGKPLVLAEIEGGKVSPATLAAVTAASKFGPVVALVAGNKESAKAMADVSGVTEVLSYDAPQYAHGLPEAVAPLLNNVVKEGGFTEVVAGSSAFGKGVLPRAAALSNVMVIQDVAKIESEDTFARFTYAGNAINTVKSKDPVKFLSVRGTSFDRAATTGGAGKVTEKSFDTETKGATWKENLIQSSDKPDLSTAANVVSGGRGLKNKENFEKLLPQLADPLKAAIGATRAVVDAGDAPNELQVGQTGKVVAPNLYVAVGISGAIQHVAGMKDSKTIVAINTDAEAPIFQVSDYGLVADLFKAVPEMAAKLK